MFYILSYRSASSIFGEAVRYLKIGSDANQTIAKFENEAAARHAADTLNRNAGTARVFYDVTTDPPVV